MNPGPERTRRVEWPLPTQFEIKTIEGIGKATKRLHLAGSYENYHGSVDVTFTNTPDPKKIYSGDFAAACVGEQHADGKAFGAFGIVVDNLTSPDCPVQDPPDSYASRLVATAIQEGLIGVSSFPHLAEIFPFDNFATTEANDEFAYASRLTIRPLETKFILNTKGDRIDIKRFLRRYYLGWINQFLQQKLENEAARIHWFAGVYAAVHAVCDFENGLIHYAVIASGDVKVTLNGEELTEDLNWAADKMGEGLGIPGVDRYQAKVFEVYDVVGPHSNEKCGPFSVVMGCLPMGSVAHFQITTDGMEKAAGADDRTQMDIIVSMDRLSNLQ